MKKSVVLISKAIAIKIYSSWPYY